MIDSGRFVRRARELGMELFTGVPDSLLEPFCSCIMDLVPRDRHIVAANEGAAVGIAMGHYLCCQSPALVYLQNSGIGHAINPLLSLADTDVYGIPMVLLVGWRGQPGHKDEPQHVKQGRVMTQLLDALELPWTALPSSTQADAESCLEKAIEHAKRRMTPYVLLVEKGTFAPYSASCSGEPPPREALPSREDALRALLSCLGEHTINISTTGMLSRELFEHREREGSCGARDFLTVGGMGHSSSIALGVALSSPEREVWCLDGDGALLMHMGTLAVIADHEPSNLFHVVFNNGVHDSVGGQPTSIGAMDIPRVASAAGYLETLALDDLELLPKAVAKMRSCGGPALLELRVRPGCRPDVGRPTRAPRDCKLAFMAGLEDIDR